jgi:PBP1b-binding outer membrane lipoprotein LpoB
MIYNRAIKVIYLLILCIVVSCSNTKPSSLTEKNENNSNVSIVETDMTNCTIDNIVGTYLPKLYIKKLQKTKSHIKASDIFSKSNPQEPNAIIIKNDEVLKVYNFHEGVNETIVGIKDGILLTKNGELIKTKIVNHDEILVDNIVYVKVSKAYDDKQSEISKFIVRSIIDPKVYKNDKGSFKVYEDGKIVYKDKKYSYGLELVFTSTKYDFIYTEDYEILNIEITPHLIRLYEIIKKKGFEEEPYADINAKYRLVDTFKR